MLIQWTTKMDQEACRAWGMMNSDIRTQQGPPPPICGSTPPSLLDATEPTVNTNGTEWNRGRGGSGRGGGCPL